MAKFFSNAQVQQAITALNKKFPEVWPRTQDILRTPTEDGDPRVEANALAFQLTFDELDFVAQTKDASDRARARINLIIDVMDVARAEFNAKKRS